MQQRSTVTIFNLAQQSLRKMKAELGFFSSSEDEKTVADLRNLVTHQNATDKDIINAFNQVKTTSSNPIFKALSQQFLSKVKSIENYVDNNKSPMAMLLSISDLTNRIFNFIPNLKMFRGASQRPLPNLFWLTQLSLVCKRMYLAVRSFRETECENPLDNKPKITRYEINPPIDDGIDKNDKNLDEKTAFNVAVLSDQDLLIEYAKGQPSVITTIDTACGYCELSLTESQIFDFEAGRLKIAFKGCQRAYVSVTCSDYGTSSEIYFTNVSYYYVDHEYKEFVALAEKNNLILGDARRMYRKFDPWLNKASYTSVKKEIKDAYQNFLRETPPKISITNDLISIHPMILTYNGWNFFKNCRVNYSLNHRHNTVKFKLAVVDKDRKCLFPEVIQELSSEETNISACQAFSNFDEKKLYLFYQKSSSYFYQLTTFYVNEWDLNKFKVHELNLSGLCINSLTRQPFRQDVKGSMYMLNARYVILKLSNRSFVESMGHAISVLAIIVYDLKRDRIVHEKYFSLNDSSGPYLNFIENLPDDKVEVYILSGGSVVISGPSCAVTIDFPVPLSKESVFDVSENDSYCKDVRLFSPSLPSVSLSGNPEKTTSFTGLPRLANDASLAMTAKMKGVVSHNDLSSVDEISRCNLDDNSEVTQDNSSAISSLEIAFYVGLLFLFIALVTMRIMSGVFAFTFSLGFLLVIPFTAFTAGFLLGYFAGEAFLVGDVSHQSDSNLVAPVLENRSREEGGGCNLLNGIYNDPHFLGH